VSDYITQQKNPTLSFSVPVYNYLLDNLEDKESEQTDETIKQIITLALNKIKSYYPTTDLFIYLFIYV
jgi:hypothetical protein